MDTQTRNRLLTYLASAAISPSSSPAGAVQVELSGIPEELIGEILDEAEGDLWKTDDRILLLSILAEDKRRQVLTRISELLVSRGHMVSWDALEPVLLKLARDATPEVQEAVARIMANALRETDAMTRTRVISEWALAASPSMRATIVKVLSCDFFCIGAVKVTAHLAMDPSPEVRAAVVDIVVARMKENPEHYQEILQTLSDDLDHHVREAAHRAAVDWSGDPSPGMWRSNIENA